MKRTMMVLVGLMLLSASVAESACKYSAKKEQSYKVRVAQFVAARAKQATSTPSVHAVPAPLAKAN